MWRRFVAISRVAFLLQFFSVCAFSQTASPQAKTGTDRTDFCWRDSATGNYIPTTPIGASPQDYFPGDNHWENPRNGKTYVHLPDGSWIDAKTGNPVPTEPLGASPIDFIPGETHWENPRNGKTYFRAPCPPPTPSTTNPPAPPPSTTSNPTPIPPNRTPTFSGLQIGVGGAIGVVGHTTTYDDGYKIGSTGFYGHGYGFINDGIGGGKSGLSKGYISAVIGITVPTETTSQNGADTQIKAVGTISGEIGFNVGKLPDGSPLTVFVNAGPAFGVESSGASAVIGNTTYSYTDTESMFGFTTGGGAKLAVTPRLSIVTEVDYLHLNQTKFASPTGSYSLGETGVSGSVGVQWNLKRLHK